MNDQSRGGWPAPNVFLDASFYFKTQIQKKKSVNIRGGHRLIFLI